MSPHLVTGDDHVNWCFHCQEKVVSVRLTVPPKITSGSSPGPKSEDEADVDDAKVHSIIAELRKEVLKALFSYDWVGHDVHGVEVSRERKRHCTVALGTLC